MILLICAVVFVGLIVCGMVYFARRSAEERKLAARPPAEPMNATPVTLDRNPEMPKMPGATS